MTVHYDYDLLVIGSGPAGHRAAIQAAKLDKRVATRRRPSTGSTASGCRSAYLPSASATSRCASF